MPPKTLKRYTPEERKAILADARATTVAKASEKHNVSTFSIYKWLGVKKNPIHKPNTKPSSSLNGVDSFDALSQIVDLLPNLGPAEKVYLLRRLNKS